MYLWQLLSYPNRDAWMFKWRLDYSRHVVDFNISLMVSVLVFVYVCVWPDLQNPPQLLIIDGLNY